MAKHIFKCEKCGKYTMKEVCSCGGKAVSPKPPKFSPEDRLGDYRRKAKEEIKETEKKMKETKETEKEAGKETITEETITE